MKPAKVSNISARSTSASADPEQAAPSERLEGTQEEVGEGLQDHDLLQLRHPLLVRNPSAFSSSRTAPLRPVGLAPGERSRGPRGSVRRRRRRRPRRSARPGRAAQTPLRRRSERLVDEEVPLQVVGHDDAREARLLPQDTDEYRRGRRRSGAPPASGSRPWWPFVLRGTGQQVPGQEGSAAAGRRASCPSRAQQQVRGPSAVAWWKRDFSVSGGRVISFWNVSSVQEVSPSPAPRNVLLTFFPEASGFITCFSTMCSGTTRRHLPRVSKTHRPAHPAIYLKPERKPTLAPSKSQAS